MSFITQKDFETKVGQEKVIKVIHTLEHKVRDLDKKVCELDSKETAFERDIGGKIL